MRNVDVNRVFAVLYSSSRVEIFFFRHERYIEEYLSGTLDAIQNDPRTELLSTVLVSDGEEVKRESLI